MKSGASGLNQLLGNSAVYAISNLLQRGLTFILLPLYTFYLTKGEFGAMDQLYQTIMVLALVASLGLPQGMVRGIYLDKGDDFGREKMLGALVAFLLPVIMLTGAGLWLFSVPIAAALFRNEGDPAWIRLAAVFFVALSVQQLPMQYLRTMQQARRYAIASLAVFGLIASTNVYFITVLHWGLRGMLVGNIIGFGATGIFLSIGFLRRVRPNLEFSRLTPLFAFGLPMLPALLARKILEISDRYILPYYHGMDELGIYVMGAKIANILDVLVLVPFLYAWQPFFYSHAENRKAPALFARVTLYFFMLLCLIFLLIEVSRDWILRHLGSGKFSASAPVIMILVLPVVFNGIQYCISPGIHLKKKLVQELKIMAGAAAANTILNFLLIPPFKGLGAAIATAAAYFLYLAGTFLLSQQNYPVPYPWLRIGNVLLQTVVAFFLIRHIETAALKCLVLAAYIVLCPFLELKIHGELKHVRL